MTRRRPVPVDAGLPRWLFGNHPVGLAAVAATILLASLLFLDAPLNQLGASLLPDQRHLFRDVTSLGNSGWKISLALAMVLMFRMAASRAKRQRTAVLYRHAAGLAGFVLASVTIAGIASSLLKQVIGRARPGTDGMFSFEPMRLESAWASFPSGHATTIFALAIALACLFPRLRLAFLSVALWVGISRVMIGVHWMSDVFAGVMLASFVVLALRRAFARRGWAFVWRGGVFRTRMNRLPALIAGDLRSLAGRAGVRGVGAVHRLWDAVNARQGGVTR